MTLLPLSNQYLADFDNRALTIIVNNLPIVRDGVACEAFDLIQDELHCLV